MDSPLLSQIATAFRKNLLPGLLLSVFGVSLIGTYYYSASVRSFLDGMGSLKSSYGFLFSAISMGLFGGFIPSMVAHATGKIPAHRRIRDTLFFTLFWAYKGIEIDFLYRVQADLFGTGSDFVTLTLKTLVDQLLYMPIIGTVPLVFLYLWKDLDYAMGQAIKRLGTRAFWKGIPVIIFTCWMVWIPAVYMIYWFPSVLQIAIANLVECFWALMLIMLTKPKSVP